MQIVRAPYKSHLYLMIKTFTNDNGHEKVFSNIESNSEHNLHKLRLVFKSIYVSFKCKRYDGTRFHLKTEIY